MDLTEFHSSVWWPSLIGSLIGLLSLEVVIRTGKATRDSIILRAISTVLLAGFMPFGAAPWYCAIALPVGFFSFTAALNAEAEDES